MADFTVNSKTLLTSVDRAADMFLIADASASFGLKKTAVNNILDLTSHPVGVDDVQVLTNKTVGITNTVTLVDNLFTLQDNSDNTKQAQFQLSGITTGTTRTYTLPNASSTLVDLSTTQTLTNKTLTSPTINTATISNPTLSVDTISEFTGANGVTIDGVKLKDGALVTTNSVITANITDAAVTPAKLIAGTGSSWVWQSWVPVYTNVTAGDGVTMAKYIQMGKTIFYRLRFTLGSTSAVSGAITFSAPVALNADYAGNDTIGTAEFLDTGTAGYLAMAIVTGGGAIELRPLAAGGTYTTYTTGASSTVPFTWANGDSFQVTGFYEV